MAAVRYDVRRRVHREVQDDPIADHRSGLNVETGIRLVAFGLLTLAHRGGAKEEDVDLKSKAESGDEIVDEVFQTFFLTPYVAFYINSILLNQKERAE